MELYLEHPGFLWILVGAVPLLVYAAIKSYAIAPRWKRILSFAVRVVALVLLVLALARPVWRLEKPDQAVVFALDVSDSQTERALEDALKHVADATVQLASHQRAALVVFGGRAQLARTLASEPIPIDDALRDLALHRTRKDATKRQILEIERDLAGDGAKRLEDAKRRLGDLDAIEARLQTSETDVREALRLARSVLPEDARRRVVLLSDGNWTRNDPELELQLLARAGVAVDTKLIFEARQHEVIAERLDAGRREVRIREPVELELQVSSAEDREVTLKLYRDQFLLKTESLALKKGRNSVRVPKQELEEGYHEFMVVLDAPGDPTPENNVARAVVVVQGRPKVLLIEAREEDARHLEQALRDEEIAVEVRPAIGFPQDLNDLLAYDVLVVSDVPATDLVTSQLALVKSYVRDFGGGFVMIGGEKSFGLGGYYRTPVEDALPVRMPIKKTIEKPNLAMVLVIDRSGSMSGEKLAIAKEAGIAAVEVMKGKDQIGVVAFDSAADWVVELSPASNREEIATQIARIVVGGGTYIMSGLHEAYDALHECNAKLKHVIVLTDGHSEGTREDYVDMASRMAAEEITISTVGIADADQALLEAIAEAGNGEYYYTNDFGSVPQIFSKETLRASKSMLVEEPFVPKVQIADDQLLRGVEMEGAPLLLGYVATTPKETARVLLTSDHGDPVLARWNYGLGRSAAFTSDAKNRWAADWISWPQFGKFWAQVVRSVMSTGATSALQQSAEIDVRHGEVRVALDSRDREGRFVDEVKPAFAIVDASGGAKALAAAHVAPGLHEVRFPLETYGDYVRLRVETKLNDQAVGLKNYAVVESYPPEYRAASADVAFLEHASAQTKGRREPTASQGFEFDEVRARGLRDLWRLCVLLAALLLPLDIALRRLW